MNVESHDPRDIPILTDAVEKDGLSYTLFDAKAVHAAIVTETLNLADSLLHQAAKDIEVALFERVFDQLRAQLPELVDRVLREHADAGAISSATTGHIESQDG
jgi:Zn-dependent M32 family carboxypeptidase